MLHIKPDQFSRGFALLNIRPECHYVANQNTAPVAKCVEFADEVWACRSLRLGPSLVDWMIETPLSFTNSLTLMCCCLLITHDFLTRCVLSLDVETAIIPIPWKVPSPLKVAIL